MGDPIALAKHAMKDEEIVYHPISGAKMKDEVNHPDHYNAGQIECIEFIEDQGMGADFCLGNAIKYIVRSTHKGNEKQDLEKAMWYLRRRIQQIDKDGIDKDGSE